ncbi:catalase-domain-containing protein [Fomitiporia mediterranea MF3/22]|uniref:catalase-domain-containing protein n=1 Tax=Fomitiporia mediterranea (strain MF3/22) TaxID=694068 RepID=UPI0004407820|nr:catalase-domain-containing protein [Fomitiporia mediterranea MF3/22]EJD04347.1 catalase-domain-containing protein [Fomitiporia mediterranea MF3/22]
MSSITSTLKSAIPGMSTNAKIDDLQKNTVDVQHHEPGLTTDFGVPYPDTDNWLKATDGTKAGPSLLEDQIAREKIHRFDHERIPERVVHARGAGAFGHFKVFDDRASKFTKAGVLTDASRATPVFVRFSTVQGPRGSADTVRDVRGFATKFYTQEGNWDLVGNDIPVFFIQDAIKFPDFVHAVKPEPHNEVPTGQTAHNNFWDFFNLQPETSHMVMWAMSDRGIPRSYRMMQGFGVNTFTLTNAAGENFFVKFHWIPELGVHSFTWDEALKLCDFHRKDLNEAIENGAPPTWTLGLQIIPEADEDTFDFDILDATKIWPEDLVPVQPIGEMVLDRTVDEYFPQTEQVAFCTSHVVPGIGFSNDPLLQGRNFSYFDTQISRLGINWEELPINRPVCPVMNFNRDGGMRHRITKGQVNYWPNRFEVVPPVPEAKGGFKEHPQKVVGVKMRARGAKFDEHWNQAQLFYNSLSEVEKTHLISAISFELDHCDDPTVYKTAILRLNDIDSELAKQVAINVGGPLPDKPGRQNHGRRAPRLSQFEFMPSTPTIKSRRIAILVADGFDLAVVDAMKAALSAAGALPFLIAPRRGEIYPEGQAFGKGQGVVADHHFEGQRSTMFDALFIPGGAESVKTLASNGRAIHWVLEAFGHLKTIGAVGEAVDFLRDAVRLPGIQFAVQSGDSVTVNFGVVTAPKLTAPSSISEGFKILKDATDFLGSFAYQVSQHKCFERETAGLASKVAF